MTLEEIISVLQRMYNAEQDKEKQWCLFVAISRLKDDITRK